MRDRTKFLKLCLDQIEAFFYALTGGLTGWVYTPPGKTFYQIFTEWKSKHCDKSKNLGSVKN